MLHTWDAKKLLHYPFLVKGGSYAGDATDNRDIPDAGFEPDFVIIG